MLNCKMVVDMFNQWRSNGIEYRYPVKGERGESKYRMLAKGFLNRYLFLQPEELEKFSSLVLESGHWPSKDESVKFIELILAENMQGLDYTAPYEPIEDEDYDSYLQRIGSCLFPKKNDKWIYDNALIIRIVYESYYCCAHCKGVCPYGNRMVGEISKQDGRLEAKRAAGMCEFFRCFRDGKGIKLEVSGTLVKESNDSDETAVPPQEGQYASDTTNYELGLFPEEALAI